MAKESPLAGAKVGDLVAIFGASGKLMSCMKITHIDPHEQFGGVRFGKYSRVGWDGIGSIGQARITGRLATPEYVEKWKAEEELKNQAANLESQAWERDEMARNAAGELSTAAEATLKVFRMYEPNDEQRAVLAKLSDALFKATGIRL